MLAAVSRSLPVLLALSVTVPDSMFHETCAVLHHPAPRLRSFSLSLNAHDSGTSISRSAGLFSGYAPCLREVRLGCPVVDACALPIFANVARLSAHSWQCSPAVSLSLHFPKLKHLYVHSSSEDPEIPPRWIDPSGVTLTSLAFKDNRWRRDQSCVTRSLEGVSAGIPVLHHFCHDETFMNWQNPPGWTGTAWGSINVYLKGPSNELNMLVCPTDHTWRRSYIFQFFDSETPIPLDEIPGLSARLEYLRLDDVVLLGFLLCGATFPALRRVRIDVADTRMAWSGWAPPQALFRGPVYSAQGRVRCPALTALALSAVHPWWEPGPDDSRDVSLRLSDVVRLCSALGLAEKPALELFEVRVDLPARWEPNVTTLHDIFSRISYLPWYCGIPCPVFDGALWEDNDAIATDRYIRQSLAR